jgi:phospholipid/cholesterol/gamma-HCH transport system substrate-binding protein
MRSLEPHNRLRIGLMGLLVTALVIGVGQSITSVPILFAKPIYYAQFTDTGGINTGDKVRIAGLNVGKVEDLKIDGDHISIKFSIGTNTIGTESRLAIRTDTLLGRKVLEIETRGNQSLRPGATLPIGQSTTPYQIYDAFFDVTKAASGWDIDTVKQSLHVLSETVDQTYPHLSAALDGVAKFSDTIGKRDEEVKHLLAQANQVASVLGDRSDQIDRALVNAKTLLAAFNERGQAIDALLGNIAAFSQQVKGLLNDNPNLNHVLEQLRTLSEVLVQRKDDLAAGLVEVGKFLPSLNESIGSGPYFKTVLHNLAPGWIVQPFIDAAFKKRGVEPACRNTAGPTPTAPGSPTARRRRRHRRWKAPRNIRDRPSRPGRRARIPRRIPAAMSPSGTRVCPDPGTRCLARARPWARLVAQASRRRSTSRRRRRILTVCHPRQVSRSPGGRANRLRTFRAHRCRCRRKHRRARAPSIWHRPARRRHRRRSRRACRRVHRHRPGRATSCRHRSSTPAVRAGAARREVARIEHYL